jgi:hypothetical protein
MKNIFKKLFKMEDQKIESSIEEFSNFSYQWIKGDQMSEVRHFKDLESVGDRKYLVFTDGSRMSLDLLDEYMIKVPKGFEETIEIKPQSQNSPAPSRVQARVEEIQFIQPDESPISSLLKKQKENWVNVDLNLKVNIPRKQLWEVLTSSFDNAEDEILNYVTRDLDIEVVKESLRVAIKDIYKSKSQESKNVRSQNTVSE